MVVRTDLKLSPGDIVSQYEHPIFVFAASVLIYRSYFHP